MARSGALVIMRLARGVLEKLRVVVREMLRPANCLRPAENMVPATLLCEAEVGTKAVAMAVADADVMSGRGK